MVQQTFSGVPDDPSPGDVIRAADADKVREFLLALVKDGTESTTGQTSSLLFDATDGVWELSKLQDSGGATIYDRANNVGMGLRQVVKFTSSGTFSKGDYSWARAVRVKVVGGGGGGGGATQTSAGNSSAGSGGGGGEYAEGLFTVDQLASSETVTVGAGGAGSTSAATGTTGGTSSFGSLVTASGGSGGNGGDNDSAFTTQIGGSGGSSGSGGDVRTAGDDGGLSFRDGTGMFSGFGGGSVLAGQRLGRSSTTTGAGRSGRTYGGGGSGAGIKASTSPDQAGGDGAAGIVIVEVYG